MKLTMILSTGDYFLLREKKESVLITDCGYRSMNQNLFRGLSFSQILDKSLKYFSTFNNKYALITHFHTDHYNGFEYFKNSPLLNSKFDCCYLPYIAGNDVAVESAILCYMLYPKHFNSANFSSNILRLIPTVCDIAKFVQPVGCDDIINKFSEPIKILWPPKDQALWMDYLIVNRHEMLTSLIGLFPNPVKGRLLQIVDELKSVYNILFTQSQSTENMKQTSLLVENHINYLEKVKKEHKQLIKNFLLINKNTCRMVATAFSKGIDEYSIVYCVNKKFLMTGDISSKNMKAAIDLYNLGHCRFISIKAPHHGTDSHFHIDFRNIITDNLLIPHYYTRKRVKKVSNFYYSTNYTSFCTCANNMCEIENIHGCPAAVHCRPKAIYTSY